MTKKLSNLPIILGLSLLFIGTPSTTLKSQNLETQSPDPTPCILAAGAATTAAENQGLPPEQVSDIFWRVLNDCFYQL